MAVNVKDIRELAKFFKKLPRKQAAAQVMWANHAVFKVRKLALDHINRTMKVRSPGFVRSRLRVQKASAKRNPTAYVGSIRAARYTGWAEQEGLAKDTREKKVTLPARGSRKGRRVMPSARLKPGHNIPSSTDFTRGRTIRKKAKGFYYYMKRQSTRKPFLMIDHGKIPSGLWKFAPGPKNRRDLTPLQLFNKKPAKTRRNPWMSGSVEKYKRTVNKKQVWRDIIRRLNLYDRK